jgi:dienelactone hydrolase
MPACCPDGSWPQLLRTKDELNQDEIPAEKGTVVSIPVAGQDDIPVYFVSPQQGKKSLGGIIVFPDIYSVRVFLPHVRSGDRITSICDALAEIGYTVALAGIFRNEPFDEAVKGPDDGNFTTQNVFAEEGGVAWFQKQNYEKMRPAVKVSRTRILQ